jgi:hypothetical protein
MLPPASTAFARRERSSATAILHRLAEIAKTVGRKIGQSACKIFRPIDEDVRRARKVEGSGAGTTVGSIGETLGQVPCRGSPAQEYAHPPRLTFSRNKATAAEVLRVIKRLHVASRLSIDRRTR